MNSDSRDEVAKCAEEDHVVAKESPAAEELASDLLRFVEAEGYVSEAMPPTNGEIRFRVLDGVRSVVVRFGRSAGSAVIDGPDGRLKRSLSEWIAGSARMDQTSRRLPADWRAFWSGPSPRTGQRDLLEDWQAVLDGSPNRHLLAHAPTGVGKTRAALAPALAWVALAPESRRIFFLVNRAAQHDNPIRELRAGLAESFRQRTGRSLRVVDLVGRGQLCRHPSARPLESMCVQSRNKADFSSLPAGVSSWKDVDQATPADGCPYHLLQGLVPTAHVVICDYWWLFSQSAHGGDLDGRIGGGGVAAIVDEAHNLPMRVRAELDVEAPAAALRNHLASLPSVVADVLMPVMDHVLRTDPDMGVSLSELLPLAGGERAVEAALAALADDGAEDASPGPAGRMLRLLLQPDDAAVFHHIPADGAAGEPSVAARMIDPTHVLKSGFARATVSLAMSGSLAAPTDTVEELEYQIPLFGLPMGGTATRRYRPPFPAANQHWVFCPDTVGTYAQRGRYLAVYADHILRIGRATPGVTAAFFSGYGFLDTVLSAMPQEIRAAVVVERPHDGPDAAERILRQLRDAVARGGPAWLFAIYQGRIAEGADFPGNLIRTVVCVSLPLERPQSFHHHLRRRIEQAVGPLAATRGDDAAAKASEYAEDRPCLSLVLQACGRGIRSGSDRCVFVLLDARYFGGGNASGRHWRRYLQPPPFNVSDPARAATSFHAPPEPPPDERWDPALSALVRRTPDA